MAEWVGRGGIPPYPSPDHFSSYDPRDVGFCGEDRFGQPRYGGDWRDDRRDDSRADLAGLHEWDLASASPSPPLVGPPSGQPSVFFVRADHAKKPPSPPVPLLHPKPQAHKHQLQSPGSYAPLMERTSSGISISTDPLPECSCCCTKDEDDLDLLTDEEAARIVVEQKAEFLRRHPDSAHERILRSLVHPRAAEADFELDDAALGSLFSATNEIFFGGRLTSRVDWDWSHWSTGDKYAAKIIGTTAMRRSRRLLGYETLIVLSSPILRDARYSRRLLISTFLHELIHSYLFIMCGHRARLCGGHTTGFRKIASLIDDFAGPGTLHLREMEADLERFRLPPKGQALPPPLQQQYQYHHQVQEQHHHHHHHHYHYHHHNARKHQQYPHAANCNYDRPCCDGGGWEAGGSHDEWDCAVMPQQQQQQQPQQQQQMQLPQLPPVVSRPPLVLSMTQHTFVPQRDLW